MENQDNYQNSSVMTILVADDMAISRKLLKTHLGPRYNVVEARNGLEVIDILKNPQFNISCVLLDMLMPVMDGSKVLAFMRENGLLEMIPVIVISAMSNAAGKIACYEAGAAEIIEKPYDPKILLNRIENCIRLYARLREHAETDESNSGVSSSFLTAILDSLPQAVFVFDRSSLRLEYCNATFEMLPEMAAAPGGKLLTEVFSPADCAAIMHTVSDLLTVQSMTPVVLNLGGRPFSFVFNAILDEAGNVADIIGTASAVGGGLSL